MATLTIPKKRHAALAKIWHLPEKEVDDLASALNQTPATLDPQRLASTILPKVIGVSAEDLTDIVDTLCELYAVRAARETTIQQFTSDIVSAMRDSRDEDLRVPEEEACGLQGRLARLLEIQTLSLVSKASDLRNEHQFLFCDARILTDLRPVFGSDPSNRPIGAVINNILKLDYHAASGHEEFYVALDLGEIAKLIEVLRRAEAKAQSLKVLLGELGIQELDSK